MKGEEREKTNGELNAQLHELNTNYVKIRKPPAYPMKGANNVEVARDECEDSHNCEIPHHDDQNSDLDDFNEETEVSSDGDRRKVIHIHDEDEECMTPQKEVRQ